MSFVPKKFCFCCRKASEELEAENKTLKFCKDCQVAQYCDKECQRLDFLDCHKHVCVKMIKSTKAKHAEVKLGFNVKGFDANESKLNLDKLKNPAVDELFMKHLQYADYNIRCIIELSRVNESYHGMELGLKKYLELMMTLQPAFLHLRNWIPLLMLQLGKDDEAYNFIKFWLKNTPVQQVKGDDQAFYWRTSEDGVFDDVLPFTEFTMTGQDKNEDIMEALSIDENKKPYFTYLVFFVTLAAIKRNNFEATKDEAQKTHFAKYLKYIKHHYKDLPKMVITVQPDSSNFAKIPKSFGLDRFGADPLYTNRGMPKRENSKEFAQNFITNWFDDFHFYMNRVPGLKKEMITHLK